VWSFFVFFFLKQHLQEWFQGWQMSAFLDDALQSALRLSQGWMFHHRKAAQNTTSGTSNGWDCCINTTKPEITCSGDTKKVGNFQGMKSKSWLWWGNNTSLIPY